MESEGWGPLSMTFTCSIYKCFFFLSYILLSHFMIFKSYKLEFAVFLQICANLTQYLCLAFATCRV